MMGLPSAVIEIQESSRARMTTVNSPGAGVAGVISAASVTLWFPLAEAGFVGGLPAFAGAGVAALASPLARGDPALAPGAEFAAGFCVAAGTEDWLGCSSLLFLCYRRLQNQSASATNNSAAANKPQGNCREGNGSRGSAGAISASISASALAAAPSPDASR